jgi:hypothetical protein
MVCSTIIAAPRIIHEFHITSEDPIPYHTDFLLSEPAALLVVLLVPSPPGVPDPVSAVAVAVAVAAACKSDSWDRSEMASTAWSLRYSDSSSGLKDVGTGIISEKVDVGELKAVTPVVLPLVYVYTVLAYW